MMREGNPVLIDWVTYEKLLDERREQIEKQFNWTIPDYAWEYTLDLLADASSSNASANSPMNVVDNLAVNGEYGDFDDYKEDDETDEEFIARVEDEAYFVDPENRVVIFSLG